jgi:RNase adapter protein RapZ
VNVQPNSTHAAEKQILLITGMSGSGKSTATRALEDAGFFCIDNLPVALLPKLVEMAATSAQPSKLALVVDARDRMYLRDAPAAIGEVRNHGHRLAVLFLDSTDDVLQRRFSETRRRHPLAPAGTVADGILAERAALKDLREMADEVIDTSALNVHDLKRVIQARYSSEQANAPSISIMSFGYRYGVPSQADLVFDVRFLPNPYFVPELKALTGKDEHVSRYVLERPETAEFLSRVEGLCRFLLPRYQKEGKAYVTLALGCTGGKHRSVAIAHELSRRLAGGDSRVQLWDRDVDRE